MTALRDEIVRLIREEGPIGVDRYMALCLGHPVHGYYLTRDPFGAAGDFVTAPEISQIFGELIGLWAAEVWRMMGEPPAVRLIELGPGRGTLMADMLRAASVLPAFRSALSVHLVETSPVLRAAQARALPRDEPVWHERVEDALDGPAIVIANEFLDALPVKQFQLDGTDLRERLVGLDDDGRLGFGLAAEPVVSGLVQDVQCHDGHGHSGHSHSHHHGPIILERPFVADQVISSVARHLAALGGAALFIDYGSLASGLGDTLQAVRRHAYADVFSAPGEADLTVQVDFQRAALVARSSGAAVHGPVTQAEFLKALGLRERAAALSRNASPRQAADIAAAVERLAGAGQAGPDRARGGMGELFKVLGIGDPRLASLPGLPLLSGLPASGTMSP